MQLPGWREAWKLTGQCETLNCSAASSLATRPLTFAPSSQRDLPPDHLALLSGQMLREVHVIKAAGLVSFTRGLRSVTITIAGRAQLLHVNVPMCASSARASTPKTSAPPTHLPTQLLTGQALPHQLLTGPALPPIIRLPKPLLTLPTANDSLPTIPLPLPLPQQRMALFRITMPPQLIWTFFDPHSPPTLTRCSFSISWQVWSRVLTPASLSFPPTLWSEKILRSARTDPETVSALLQAELEKGYLIGPFEYPPFPTFRTNPLGLAEKKYSNKKRLILDLSSPHDDPENPSLNNLIAKEEYSLSYVRIDDAIKIIKLLGPNSWLSKTDMVDAFKQVPIHPSLWPLHGLKWDNQYHFFTRLVFGSRSSPKIFSSLSSAICWITRHHYNLAYTVHLLDDFLVIDAPHADADRSMALLTMIFGKLHLPLSKPKTIDPSHCLEYLGITLDTVNMQARLPEDKLHRLRGMIASLLQARSCVKIDLLRLFGHLNFAARVVAPGRPFMYRLFQAAFSIKHLFHPVWLTQEAKLDLKVWSHLLSHWNGISLFLDDSPTDAGLFTDASGSIGFGGFFQGRWFQGHWSDIQNLPPNPLIAFKELLPTVIAAILWGDDWQKRKLVFYSDNQATVHILNKKSSRCPFIMRLVRRLVIGATLGNFTFEGRHIADHTNSLADSLSPHLRFGTFALLRHAHLGVTSSFCAKF